MNQPICFLSAVCIGASLLLGVSAVPECPNCVEVKYSDAVVPYLTKEYLPILNKMSRRIAAAKKWFPALKDYKHKERTDPFQGIGLSYKMTGPPPIQRQSLHGQDKRGPVPSAEGCYFLFFLEPFDRTCEKGGCAETSSTSRPRGGICYDQLGVRFVVDIQCGSRNKKLERYLLTVLDETDKALSKLARKYKRP